MNPEGRTFENPLLFARRRVDQEHLLGSARKCERSAVWAESNREYGFLVLDGKFFLLFRCDIPDLHHGLVAESLLEPTGQHFTVWCNSHGF